MSFEVLNVKPQVIPELPVAMTVLLKSRAGVTFAASLSLALFLLFFLFDSLNKS